MSGLSARAALRPGDVLVVRTSGFAAELIRIGEELSGKPGLQNHVAVFHHWTGSVPWGLEGKPGGVGWADLRPYLRSGFTINNCLQPGRDDAGRAQVCAEAERMLGTAYDWMAIADDTLRAFHMADLFASTWHGAVPGHIVCSSYAAFLYGRQGWERPQVPARDTEPSDWCAYITEHHWSATIGVLRLERAGVPRGQHHRRTHLGLAGPGAAGQPDARRTVREGGHRPGPGGTAPRRGSSPEGERRRTASGDRGDLMTRNFTVRCAEHGEMTHDVVFEGWTCPHPGGCRVWLPDSEVRRLVTGAPDGSPDPVPIVVT